MSLSYTKQAKHASISEFVLPVRELKEMVEKDPTLAASTNAMFNEALEYHAEDPTKVLAVGSWYEFLDLLNSIVTEAPKFILDEDTSTAHVMIGFPINTILHWPMGTTAGQITFSNAKFNRYLAKVLNFWSHYLLSSDSRSVFVEGDPHSSPPSIPWLSDAAKREMVQVAMQPYPNSNKDTNFEEIYVVPDPSDAKYLGFTSWDHFFTREFRKGQRPIGTAVVVSACESAPLQCKTNVLLSSNFRLKGQPYSLNDMLNKDPLAKQFVGGTVYQAYLSALSYHRWHSPVDGLIVKTSIVDGTYFLASEGQGIYSPEPDPASQTRSQAFLTSVQTRAIVFIKADDDRIGLTALVFVGMGEVSSCEVNVKENQTVKKGDQLGMFHFGGSTYCQVFRPESRLHFHVEVEQSPNFAAPNVAVNSNLASLA